MDLFLDQRGPLITRRRGLLTDFVETLHTLRLHSDCVSSLSVIDLSRTFILIGSGTRGHGLLADICSRGTFPNGIFSFLPLSRRRAVGLGLHNVFSLLQLVSQRNPCGFGCQVPNPQTCAGGAAGGLGLPWMA